MEETTVMPLPAEKPQPLDSFTDLFQSKLEYQIELLAIGTSAYAKQDPLFC